MSSDMEKPAPPAVAIIGLAGRFPGAGTLAQFWNNLRNGVESITLLTDEEIIANGVSPELLADPNYVKKSTLLENVGMFDAGFFGFNAREAEIIDPQHRVFLECAWEALEDAGYARDSSQSSVGVYAGTSMNTYLLTNLLTNRRRIETVGAYQVMLGNDKDFLATRVSYKLNLKGPGITLQTACSTSLVAIQLAWQALLDNQCDMALAGGVSISFPQNAGYLYSEGMIFSPDGHCRPFDAKGKGIRSGAGAGIVVMKRLADALADRDHIRAVIRGAAINNDGSRKMGYTAPSVDGQAEVIALAQARAGINPETISYIEAHGTATQLGDPIEIAALTQAFRTSTDKSGYCAIGSIKSNIGHLDAAAGVSGVVKTVLALEHKEIPPTLNFESPNPQIDFEHTPFYVNSKLSEWKSGDSPRRAGVSSFGIGGTNAHIILEEAPANTLHPAQRPAYLLPLSARSPMALEAATDNLIRHFQEHPDTNIAAASYTLQAGRKRFEHRRAAVCRSLEDASAVLQKREAAKVQTGAGEGDNPNIVFLFSGQGSQYPGMGSQLYQVIPVFRETFDYCAERLAPRLELDLRHFVLSAAEEASPETRRQLNETRVAQAALFALEYSLAKTWMHWGIHPKAMIGHSIGEYAAAALAGVFSLDDALELVALRGQLMQKMPTGKMLAVHLPEKELAPRLGTELEIAAVNAPNLCTVTGQAQAIESFANYLAERDIESSVLHTSHAFHSAMMDPVLEPFASALRQIPLQAPRLPFLSNLTGSWIKPEEAADAGYWARHLRHTVRFAEGIREILATSDPLFLEVGPGNTLATFAQLCGGRSAKSYASIPHARDQQPGYEALLQTLGRLWIHGANPDWEKVHDGEQPGRIPLPAYPFERQLYWVEPKPFDSGVQQDRAIYLKNPDMSKWFYIPSWKRRSVLNPKPKELEKDRPWIVFSGHNGFGTQLSDTLRRIGHRTFQVEPSSDFRIEEDRCFINPANREHFGLLIEALKDRSMLPGCIVHAWNVGKLENAETLSLLDIPFFSILYLLQALGDAALYEKMSLFVIGSGMQSVLGTEVLHPQKAASLGICRVIPLEYPQVRCRCIDIENPRNACSEAFIGEIIEELRSDDREPAVAYRGRTRWVQSFDQVPLDKSSAPNIPAREEGVYLITGGIGGMGLTFARQLAESGKNARIALLTRTQFPPREKWDELLAAGQDGRIGEQIEAIRSIESVGARCLLLDADVSDRNAMSAAMENVHKAFGRINGVIHAAGSPGAGAIQFQSRDNAEKVFAPKIQGTLILQELLDGQNLDFFILCSSFNSIVGTPGASDYAAANAFLDAFACQKQLEGNPSIIAINWDTWQKVGMAVHAEAREVSLLHGILPAEGIEALRRALSLRMPQVAVVTRDLVGMLKKAMNPVEDPGQMDDSPAAPRDEGTSQHSRPSLLSLPYRAAENDREKAIVAIWSEVLGIDGIGIDDNFFELGGHSLLATGMMGRIHKALGIKLPLRTIFEAPTVRELARQVESKMEGVPNTASLGDREEFEL